MVRIKVSLYENIIVKFINFYVSLKIGKKKVINRERKDKEYIFSEFLMMVFI